MCVCVCCVEVAQEMSEDEDHLEDEGGEIEGGDGEEDTKLNQSTAASGTVQYNNNLHKIVWYLQWKPLHTFELRTPP